MNECERGKEENSSFLCVEIESEDQILESREYIIFTDYQNGSYGVEY